MKLGRGVAIAVVVFGAVLSAISCGKTENGTDSNTHWMESCDEDGDCGNLSCLCGVCTQACDDEAACAIFGGGAVCSSVPGCISGEGDVCRRAVVGGQGSGGAASGGASGTGGITPSSGGTPDIPDAPVTGPCAPMNAIDTFADCNEPRRWHWDGDHCRPTVCCAGTDCDRRYDTVEACDQAHAACYAENGISRSCTRNSDCVLTERNCCFCGETTSSDVIAMRAESALPYKTAACDYLRGECPPCVPVENPSLSAICLEGECRVLDVTAFSTCDQDENCIIRDKSCCETCSEFEEDVVAISSDDDTSLVPFRQLVCGSSQTGLCDAVACGSRSNMIPKCDMGRCTARPVRLP